MNFVSILGVSASAAIITACALITIMFKRNPGKPLRPLIALPISLAIFAVGAKIAWSADPPKPVPACTNGEIR